MENNVFKKLAEVSAHMSTIGLKQHGKNDYANFEYFELDDFLPQLLVKCNEVGLYNHFNFFDDHAELTVINTDAPDDRIEFLSPSGACNLKGCQEMQNVGGVETFQRRYLLTNAYGINSGDIMTRNSKNPAMYDNCEQKKEKPKKKNEPAPSVPKPPVTPVEHRPYMPVEEIKKLDHSSEICFQQCKKLLLDIYGYDFSLKTDDERNKRPLAECLGEIERVFQCNPKAFPPQKYEEFFEFAMGIHEVTEKSPKGPEAFKDQPIA